MKGLLIKDFKLMEARGLLLIFIVAAYTVLQLYLGKSEMGVAFTTLMFAGFSISTITYDEYDNGMPFLLMLPITRREYVREKFAFGFLLTTVTWLLVNVICFALEPNSFWEKISVHALYLLSVYLFVAFEIALKLKFQERSGIVQSAIVLIIGALLTFVYVTDRNTELHLELLGWNVFLTTVVILMVMIYGFYRWSVRIMEEREL